MKRCAKCDKMLPLEAFGTKNVKLKKGTVTRYQSYCKECTKKYRKTYFSHNTRKETVTDCTYCTYNEKTKGCRAKMCVMLEG